MKKQATPAQIAESKARKVELSKTWAKIKALPEDKRLQFVGAVVTCEGHQVSLNNSMLALCQRPTVSVIGGFHQWRKAGRKVKAGAKAVYIWVPLGRSDDDESAKMRFSFRPMFDIADTEAIGAKNNSQGDETIYELDDADIIAA